MKKLFGPISMTLLLVMLATCSTVPDRRIAPISSVAAYAPAETAYFLANKRTPDPDVAASSWRMIQPTLDFVQTLITVSLSNQDAPPALVPVMIELDGKLNRTGFSELGLDGNGDIAIYGHGVFPVIRAHVADAELLEQTLSRILANAGDAYRLASFDDMPYHELTAGKVRILLITRSNQMIMSIFHQDYQPVILPHLFAEGPMQLNILNSGQIDQVNSALGTLEQSPTIHFDTGRFMSAMVGPGAVDDPVFAEFAGMLGEVCIAEIMDMTTVVPSTSAGYTIVNESVISSVGVLAIRPDLNQGLRQAVRSVPGIGARRNGLINFGMGFDIPRSREFLAQQAGSILADPYQCEFLSGLNSAAAKLDESMKSPLPPFIANFFGFRLNLVDANLATELPTELKAVLMLSIDSAPTLLMMVSALMPELADLGLQPDGVAVSMPEGMIPIPVENPSVAMSESAIVMTVGSEMVTEIDSYLTAIHPEKPILMSIGYSGEGMDYFNSMNQSALKDYFSEAGEALPSMYGWLDYLNGDLYFSDDGLMMTSYARILQQGED